MKMTEQDIKQAVEKELERLEEIIWRKVNLVDEEAKNHKTKGGKKTIGQDRAKEIIQEILLEMWNPGKAPTERITGIEGYLTKAHISPIDRRDMRKERKARGY